MVKDRMIPITITMPTSMVEIIDKQRGKVKRSPYMVEMLDKQLNEMNAKSPEKDVRR